jgi:PIN domain nuclease of toxin-antitoxin system
MRLLLDTHLLIWAMGDPWRLGASLRDRLDDPAHTLLFSVASLWELVIKAGLGHGGFQVEPPLLRRGLLDGGWQELSITARHVFAVAQLPPLHRDPFDRLLLAQAMDEGLLLLTADAQLGRYPGPVEVVAAGS